ncbi:MAG TPA: DUF4421 family protein [Cyclobacteriaceae bacterium]|nr:DUF4421 family protein [Cyclobacteriaceae bacterium]
MRRILFIAFIISAHSASGQGSVDTLRSFYIQEYQDKFFIWPVLKHRSLTFQVSDRKNDKQAIEFKPNNTASLGFGFYLFEVGFEIAFAIPINERQKEIFGDTKARDLQINVLTKSWGVDLYHQRYTGFYKDDQRTSVIIDGSKRPDIDTRNFGVSGVYIFNHRKFSLRSSYNFAERQIRKKGSFILYGTINSFKADADSAMLSPKMKIGFRDGSNFEDLKYTTLSVAPGYSYNYVLNKFFINGTLTVGPAHHWVYYQEDTGEEHYDVSFNATTTFRFAIGYNSDRIFGGLGLSIQSRTVAFEDIRFENSSSTVRVLIGYRFTEKGVLKNRVWDFIPFLKGS